MENQLKRQYSIAMFVYQRVDRARNHQTQLGALTVRTMDAGDLSESHSVCTTNEGQQGRNAIP